MTYSVNCHTTITDIDAGAWRQLTAGAWVSLDPRLLAALEASLRETCRFWYALFRDNAGLPVACAALFSITVDAADMVDERLARYVRRLPGVLRRQRALLCGVPISLAECGIAMTPDCHPEEVLRLLDGLMTRLAKENGAATLGFKEFDRGEVGWADALLRLGYRRVQSLRAYDLRGGFQDLDAYLAALRPNYRRLVRRSLEKLSAGGATAHVLTEPAEIAAAYDERLHGWYLEVVARAPHKLEVMPRRFFVEMTQRFPGEAALAVIEREGELLGFMWLLGTGDVCWLMWVGMQEGLNEVLDLYFNLFYAGLDYAFRHGFKRVALGQTGEGFKARLGAAATPRYVYLMGAGLLTRLLLRYGLPLLAPRHALPPQHHVFREA